MIGTTILSSLLGIGGSIATNVMTYKTKKLELKEKEIDHKFELDRMQKESDLTIKEIDANIKVSEVEFAGKADLTDAQAFVASQNKDNKNLMEKDYFNKLFEIKGKMAFIAQPVALLLIVLFGLVDVVRKGLRPAITIALFCFTSWIALKTYILDTTILAKSAPALFMIIVETILQLMVISLSWWFSSRELGKKLTSTISKKINK
jgi:hypothetical protein